MPRQHKLPGLAQECQRLLAIIRRQGLVPSSHRSQRAQPCSGAEFHHSDSRAGVFLAGLATAATGTCTGICLPPPCMAHFQPSHKCRAGQSRLPRQPALPAKGPDRMGRLTVACFAWFPTAHVLFEARGCSPDAFCCGSGLLQGVFDEALLSCSASPTPSLPREAECWHKRHRRAACSGRDASSTESARSWNSTCSQRPPATRCSSRSLPHMDAQVRVTVHATWGPKGRSA